MTETNTSPTAGWNFGPPCQRFGIVSLVIIIACVTLFSILISPVWKRIEQLDSSPDYRVPYALSHDYWLYQRHVEQADGDDAVYVVGDSVVWGEYVKADGTLSHFLNESGSNAQFVNAGINGLFPLALEGLVRHFGHSIQGKKVLLHCNLLWLSSPEADLSSTKEQPFNHVELVPQFTIDIPCYTQTLERRLGFVMQRSISPLRWASHLQHNYFDSQNIPGWTLTPGPAYPPSFPNTYRNPLAQIDLKTRSDPIDDPERGPTSERHRSWDQRGLKMQDFAWMQLESSLQWAAYQRLVRLLTARGNDVLVVIGPFNEHMLKADDLAVFASLKSDAQQGLSSLPDVQCIVPPVLASSEFGDTSHPLTSGYAALADILRGDAVFQAWLE